MATTATKADLVICMEAHCNPNTMPPGQVVLYESEWHADDPVVAAAPHLFISKDAPRSAWKTPWDTVVARNDANSARLEEERKAARARTAAANKVKPQAPKYLTAKKEFQAELDGVPATIEKGSQFPEDHPLVAEHSEMFR